MPEPVKAEVEKKLLECVRRHFTLKPGQPLDLETHLLREGIVDSIGIIKLVRLIEERFEFAVEPGELVLHNFESIGAIRDYVLKRLTAAN